MARDEEKRDNTVPAWAIGLEVVRADATGAMYRKKAGTYFMDITTNTKNTSGHIKMTYTVGSLKVEFSNYVELGRYSSEQLTEYFVAACKALAALNDL